MKALICGAGLAGLALAQRLDTAGWDVVVLEKAHGPRRQGYMIDFFGAGYDAAEAMGALPRLQELGYRLDGARLVDDAGRRRGRLGFEEFSKVVRGRMVSIMRPDLEWALRERLSDRVDLRFAARLTGVDADDDGVRATLDDGSMVDADLLVGADGIHSTVRGLVLGEEQRYIRYLGFHTAGFVFEDPRVHAELDGGFSLTDTVERQMGLYGLRDGRVAVLAVHRTPDPTLPDDIGAALRREYGSLGWVVPRALAACPPDDEVYYDQVAQVEVPRWSAGRVVLAGDACQAVSLLAGHGASLAVAGAYVLAEELDRAGSVEDAVERYEQRWRPVVEEKQRVGRQAARWFLPASRAQLLARRAMMGLTRLPGVGRLIAGSLAGTPTRLEPEPPAAQRRRAGHGPPR